jgi:hypothetical protein
VIVGYATGEAREPPLRPTFDRRIKLEFHGARISSDGGLLAYRELDDALGLTDLAITQLLDGRRGKNTRHPTSAAPAIIRSSCSTSSATWSVASCGPAMPTAPKTGAWCWSR